MAARNPRTHGANPKITYNAIMIIQLKYSGLPPIRTRYSSPMKTFTAKVDDKAQYDIDIIAINDRDILL